MKIKFTPEAVNDLQSLKQFIADKNPEAARRIILSLQKKILMVTSNPRIGRVIEDIPDCRELVTHRYITRYTILKNDIWILRIWHQKENRSQ